MKIYSLHIKQMVFLLLAVFLLSCVLPKDTVYGASLTYYDYTKGKTVTYTGQQVTYLYNSRTLPLEQPGILIDGTALADCQTLFVEQLGLTVINTQDQLTITDGKKIMMMQVGSNDVILDGISQKMNVAPVKLQFSDGPIRIYVPTRIISEYFGFTYAWTSSDSTVKITKTLQLHDGEQNFTYNGTFYSVSYGTEPISLGTMPVLYYEGSVLAPAAAVFRAAGCIYEEFGDQMLLSKGDIIASLTFGDKTAYVNSSKFVMDAVPCRITNLETQETVSYVPLEFAADILGFELTYEDKLKQYTLTETVTTGVSELNSLLRGVLPQYSDSDTVYYHWTTDASAGKTEEYHYLTEMKAYSVEHADIVELYGVSAKDINAFIDGGLLVLDMKNTISCLENQYYNEYDNPHLTYTLLSGLSERTVIYFMIPAEDTWHIVEKNGFVQLVFSAADISVEDLTISSAMQANHPDHLLVIPMPDTVTRITDQDNYLSNNFQIKLEGNHLNFYRTNAIYNPYYVIKNYTVSYDDTTNYTVLTFRTNTICGYQYSIQENALYVQVGRPKEIYKKIVVLDAGHGGIDPGASKKGYNEKDLNFTILNTYVKNKFRNSDIKIYFTRETDVLIDLYDRAAFASEVGADLFLSLHMNANNSSSVSGTEVFYSKSNNGVTASGLNSYTMAKIMADNISNAIGTKNRGASSAEFVVVKYNTVPAVLIELGFMTNTSDLAKLTDAVYQEKAATAIYNTVVQIFNDYPVKR